MAIRKRSRKIKRKEQRAAKEANATTPLTYTQAKWICAKHNVDRATVTLGEHANIADPRLSEAVTVVNMEEALNEIIEDGIIEAEGDMLRMIVDPDEAKALMRKRNPNIDEVEQALGFTNEPADDRSPIQKIKDWATK